LQVHHQPEVWLFQGSQIQPRKNKQYKQISENTILFKERKIERFLLFLFCFVLRNILFNYLKKMGNLINLFELNMISIFFFLSNMQN